MKHELSKEMWKQEFLECLIHSKKVCLAFRPYGVKFDEDKAVVRLDLDTYNGLSVGDICICTSTGSQWYIYSGVKIGEKCDKRCRVLTFVELIGHLENGKGIKIKDMFCALKDEDSSIMRLGDVSGSPILLYWVGGLQKIGQK